MIDSQIISPWSLPSSSDLAMSASNPQWYLILYSGLSQALPVPDLRLRPLLLQDQDPQVNGAEHPAIILGDEPREHYQKV